MAKAYTKPPVYLTDGVWRMGISFPAGVPVHMARRSRGGVATTPCSAGDIEAGHVVRATTAAAVFVPPKGPVYSFCLQFRVRRCTVVARHRIHPPALEVDLAEIDSDSGPDWDDSTSAVADGVRPAKRGRLAKGV